jgi:hypothetical protein
VLALVLELAVPPLSLLALLWAGSVAAATLAGLAGASWVPTALLAAGAGLLAVAMLAVWARFGRAILPLGAVLALPGYVLAKVPLYVAFVTSRQTAWVRTRRSAEHSEGLQSTHDGRPPGGEAG